MHSAKIIDKYKLRIIWLLCSASFQLISIAQTIEPIDNTRYGIEITKPASIGYFDMDYAIDAINPIQSGIEVARAGYNIGYMTLGFVHPTESQQLIKRFNDRGSEIKKAEEELIKCVSQNAYNFREKNQLPYNCEKVSDFYAAVSGFEPLSKFNAEFNAVMDELPASRSHPPQNQTGMATGTKIVIGVVVVIGATGAFLICAPVLLPGTVVAAKATAITTGIKTATAGVASKASALIGGDTAVQLLYESKEVVDALPLFDKVAIGAKVINTFVDAPDDVQKSVAMLESVKKGSKNRQTLLRAKIEEYYGIKH
ncbi:hypothetical protein HYX58_00710 [Candidatus Dependentiae bacterium]|nr:hypothetical protein [Candidatus Dependentiae bacterium]